MRLAALFGAFAAVSVAIGWWWKRRVWLIATAIFLGITVPFFTTFFTNGVGLGTGFVGSLGYWLEQQGVQRGSQPIYYYFVVTPIYEYLPMLISSIAAILLYRARHSPLAARREIFCRLGCAAHRSIPDLVVLRQLAGVFLRG